MNFVGNTASRSIFTSVRNSRGRSRQIAREDKNDFNTRLLVNYSNPFRGKITYFMSRAYSAIIF
jgi:hypothetical protein